MLDIALPQYHVALEVPVRKLRPGELGAQVHFLSLWMPSLLKLFADLGVASIEPAPPYSNWVVFFTLLNKIPSGAFFPDCYVLHLLYPLADDELQEIPDDCPTSVHFSYI